MRLIQKTYLFQSDKRISPNMIETNSLKLVINEIITDLSIKELFDEYSVSAGYFKGWSPLMFLEDQDQKGNFNSLELNGENFKIGFISESGAYYQIYRIKDPFAQWPEKDMEQSEVERILALLNSTQPEPAADPAIETEVPLEKTKVSLEELVADSGNTAADNTVVEAEDEASKGSSAAAAAELGGPEADAAPAEKEEPAPEPTLDLSNSNGGGSAPVEEATPTAGEVSYATYKMALEKNGYKEYTDREFSLFGKAEAEPYLFVRTEEEAIELEIDEVEKTDEFGDYFATYAGEPIVFRYKAEEDELTVFEREAEPV